jgi:hypothetical protein
MRKTVEPTESQMGDAGLISTERKVRVGFGFALACLVAIAVVSYLSVVRVNENRAWVEHTHEVLAISNHYSQPQPIPRPPSAGMSSRATRATWSPID